MGMAPLRRDGEGPGAASDVEQTNRRTESGGIEQRALDDSLAGGQPDDRVVRGRERLEPQRRDERRILCASPRRCVCRRGLVHAASSSWRCGLTSYSMSCSLRSEEHTSELQSLMRISYAVFCLKKNKP